MAWCSFRHHWRYGPWIHLEGFKPGELRISAGALAEIYLGKIAKWNDAKLVALNPARHCQTRTSLLCTVPMVRVPPSTSRTI